MNKLAHEALFSQLRLLTIIGTAIGKKALRPEVVQDLRAQALHEAALMKIELEAEKERMIMRVQAFSDKQITEVVHTRAAVLVLIADGVIPEEDRLQAVAVVRSAERLLRDLPALLNKHEEQVTDRACAELDAFIRRFEVFSRALESLVF